MWIFWIGLFSVWPFLAAVERNLLNTNGWIPVSSETVYNQMKRESAQVPFPSHSIQALNTDVIKVMSQDKWIEEIVDDAQTDGYEVENKCAAGGKRNCQNEKLNDDEIMKPDFDFVPSSFLNTSTQKDTADKNARRSKKMTNVSFKDYVQQLLLNEEKVTAKEKSYKVTEESESEEKIEREKKNIKEDLEDKIGQEKINTKDSGYKYEPPKQQNPTNELFEILAKYRINKDDKLPNYALSRRQKAQIPLKQNVSVKPFQNQLFYKYNNLNHLPVDPLLAVFLSNYGFYLQGMYGINNRYNNLYGYLASNNIHNNRPFGFYKVFSDTDSSN